MNQLRKYLLITVFGFLHVVLHAQFNPFSNSRIDNYYHLETGGSEQNWCITKDLRGVVYAGNDENGILEFDGSTWRSIPGSEESSVRSLVTGDDGVVYAGLEGDFGKLESDISGRLEFRSLANDSLRQLYQDFIIWKSYAGNAKVYFCSSDAIFVYDPPTGELEIIQTPADALFTYLIGEDLYVTDFYSGLMRLEENAFVQVPGGEYFIEKDVFSLAPMGPDKLLMGMRDRGVVLFDLREGTVDSTFLDKQLNEELISAWVLNLLVLEEHILIGTFSGGLYMLDRQGRLQETISQRQGLINETIADIFADPDDPAASALWIAHWKGISRIELNNPLRTVPLGRGRMELGGRGSDESIQDITEFSGELFVASSSGLFREVSSSGTLRFRSIRDIPEAIFDLQTISPAPGIEYLLASGREHIYVLDQNMGMEKLSGGGRKMLADPGQPDVFYIAGREFSGIQYRQGKWESIVNLELEGVARQMCMDKFASIWIYSSSGLIRLDGIHSKEGPRMIRDLEIGLPEAKPSALFVDPESHELLAGSDRGFYRFDYRVDSMVYDTLYNSILPEGDNHILTVYHGLDGIYWFSFENEFSAWGMLGAERTSSGFRSIHERAFKALNPGIATHVLYADAKKQLWFGRGSELYQFNPDLASEAKESMRVLMRQVRFPGDSVLFNGTHFITDASGQRKPRSAQSKEEVPGIDYKYRDISFQWSSPYYKERRRISYSYLLKGFSADWSDWERSRSAKFTNLRHGRYEMQVKARNVFGDESPPAIYTFKILRPWYATILAISIYLILLAALFFSITRYTRKLRMRATVLERKNREIEQQKEELQNLNAEITAQRDEIETQRDSISVQKELIDRQNAAMTDSIHYAKRIQDAVLPAKEVMRFLLPKHFVFYRPRDIVSGDFFWVDKRDETILLAVADCTGHGVPGAFMSMLGISLLNEIASKYSDHPINEIMDELRDRVIASLGQTGDIYETRDGIEMGLLAINPSSREIQFTGANMNLYTFQKGKLVVVNGDRMPVGIHSEGNAIFSLQELKMSRGDTLYLFSDGYPDQFGGRDRKRYGSARLKKLLTSIQQYIMHDQKAAIDQAFEKWKGEEDQIDDVLMVGIKL